MQIHFVKTNVQRIQISFSLSFQDLTNFRSSKGCGCHFWNIQRAEHSFLCFTTFSLALLQCPFAQLVLKCSLFILFCKLFLPSMHCKIIYWLSNPLIYELRSTCYLPLIYELIIRGGERPPPSYHQCINQRKIKCNY